MIPWTFAVVGSVFLSACWAALTPPEDPLCARMAAPKTCGFDATTDSPEQLESRRRSMPRMGEVAAIMAAARCPKSVTVAVQVRNDACLASIEAVLPQATAEAAARRAAAGPAVASLRADARYAPAREKYHKTMILQSAACNASNGITVDTGCKFASSDVGDARATMRSLFEEHHLDLRDADALNLW